MNEKTVNFKKKQSEKWMNENGHKMKQILWMIANQDKYKTESYDIKSIENIQRLREFLNKYVTDEYAVLMSSPGKGSHLTLFHVKDKEKFLQQAYNIAIEVLGDEVLFKIELLTRPVSITFHNDKEELTLVNYNAGMIKC